LQCCRSGLFIPDPDFYPSRNPDLGSRIRHLIIATKEEGEKCCPTFFVATNITKFKIILFLNRYHGTEKIKPTQ
jgi:hypothetical protein